MSGAVGNHKNRTLKMAEEIKIGKKIFIRNAGKNEYWLQDIIYENPKILGLGNLVPVYKEKDNQVEEDLIFF